MGYFRHHAIVVTAMDPDSIEAAHKKAIEIFGTGASQVLPQVVNGFVSFFVGPDGSKERFEESNAGNARREQFTEWLSDRSKGIITPGLRFNTETMTAKH